MVDDLSIEIDVMEQDIDAIKRSRSMLEDELRGLESQLGFTRRFS